MRRRVPALVWVAVAALAVVSAVVWDASEEPRAFPSAESRRPSGTSALRELLQAEGFPVRVDASARVRPAAGTVVVAFKPVEHVPFRELLEEEGEAVLEPDGPSPAEQALEAAAKGGCTVVLGRVGASPLAQAAARSSAEYAADVPASKTVRIPVGAVPRPEEALADGSAPYEWWRSAGHWPVTVTMVGAGRVVVVPDALSATNRYLDEDDAAEFWVGLLGTLGAKEHGVLFADALSGNEQTPGLLGSLGPWAVAAQWQALFAFLLFGLWAGQRMGGVRDPEVRQATVAGTTGALARTLAIGGQYGTACRLVGAERLTTLRRILRLPAGTEPRKVLAELPGPVGAALGALLAAPDRLPARQAVEMVRALDAAVAEAGLDVPRQ